MATTRRLIGNIKGPKGDTGATGATGAQGPAGQDGAPGVNDYATTEAAGLVRVGDDFNINSSNGTLSIKNAFTRASALAKMVTDEAFATTLGKIAKAVDWVVDNAPNFFNKSTDIVDGFTSSLTNKALSANAGKTLKTQLDSLNDSLSRTNIQSLAYRGEQNPGDANDMADGIRYFPSQSTNVPELYCIILQWSTSGYKLQIAVPMGAPNKLYQRKYSNSGWSSWYYTNMTVVS